MVGLHVHLNGMEKQANKSQTFVLVAVNQLATIQKWLRVITDSDDTVHRACHGPPWYVTIPASGERQCSPTGLDADSSAHDRTAELIEGGQCRTLDNTLNPRPL